MSTRNVEAEYMAAFTAAGSLPAAEQTAYRAQLAALRARARKPAVSGDGDEWEWDLALANQLDRIYGTIAARASQVYGGLKSEASDAVDALATGAAKVGIGLWPLAFAAAVVFYYYGKRGR